MSTMSRNNCTGKIYEDADKSNMKSWCDLPTAQLMTQILVSCPLAVQAWPTTSRCSVYQLQLSLPRRFLDIVLDDFMGLLSGIFCLGRWHILLVTTMIHTDLNSVRIEYLIPSSTLVLFSLLSYMEEVWYANDALLVVIRPHLGGHGLLCLDSPSSGLARSKRKGVK